jgi:hypothetical protein
VTKKAFTFAIKKNVNRKCAKYGNKMSAFWRQFFGFSIKYQIINIFGGRWNILEARPIELFKGK